MTNPEKAAIYEACIAESDELHRKINRIKSDHFGNIPEERMIDIRVMEGRIQFLVERLNSLFLD